MNDPGANFASSLRSSPSKSPARRSSLSVSNWHEPENIKPKSVPSSVRKHSVTSPPPKPKVIQPVIPDHSAIESKVDRRFNAKDQSSLLLWEPPISCKRRLIRTVHGDYHSFFPVELTPRDYFYRLLSLLSRAMGMLSIGDLSKTSSSRYASQLHSSVSDEFVNLLVANAQQFRPDEFGQKFALLWKQPSQANTCPVVEEAIIAILDEKYRLYSHVSGWSTCRLTDMKEVFRAFEKVLGWMLAGMGSHLPAEAQLLQQELRLLQNQVSMHGLFKTERMQALGWQWDANDSLPEDTSDPEELSKNAFDRYENLVKALDPYMTPDHLSLVQLATRILGLEEELQRLSMQSADQSDYDEAQRLRYLAHSMEDSVSPDIRMMIDIFNGHLLEVRALTQDLDHLVVVRRTQRLFELANKAEEASMHIQQIAREASLYLQTEVMLTSAPVMEHIAREGTEFINSDYLFLTEQWKDQQSLASLLIRAASHDMLHAIEQWPELTALRTSAYLRSQNQQLMVSDANGGWIDGQYDSMGNPNADQFVLGHHDSSANYDYLASHGSDGQSQSSSFSVQVLDALKAFDILQHELDQLLSTAAIAHSQLICRLIGVSNDLRSLTDISDNTHQPMAQGQNSLLPTQSSTNPYAKESDRLRMLIAAVEGSIDADELTADDDPQTDRNLCGRRRIDYIWQVIDRIKPGIRELMKLKSLARNYRDFTAAAALETMQVSLESRIKQVEDSIVSFSILDTDNDVHIYDGSVDVNERIAREGTSFLTSDYIFAYSCGAKGHSIGSLAIVAGAGAILRSIKQTWPQLTALGNASSGSELNLDSSLPARKRSMTSTLGSTNAPGAAASSINFHDANALRLLGFDPSTLRVAGFSTVDILTAGFTAEQLKLAGFDAQTIHSAVGLVGEQMLFLGGVVGGNATTASSGHSIEVFAQLLKELYESTKGTSWKNNHRWPDLEYVLGIAANNYIKPDSNGEKISLMAFQHKLKQIFQRLHGLHVDSTSFDIQKLVLPQNNLGGSIPSSIGSIVTLQHLVLSNNSLTGVIPASIGMLVNLQTLMLDHNKLQGEIPRTVKQLQRLIILRLEHNELEGSVPPILGNLSKLKRLDLSHNRLSGPLPLRLGSSGQMQLQELLLNDNALTGEIPATWCQLTNLMHLNLQNNKLTGNLPSAFSQLQKLTGLNLQNNAGLTVNRQHLQKSLPKCRIKL